MVESLVLACGWVGLEVGWEGEDMGLAGDEAEGLAGCFTEKCCGNEAGSNLRRIDSCITQLKVQGPSGTYHEGKEEEEEALLVLHFRARHHS